MSQIVLENLNPIPGFFTASLCGPLSEIRKTLDLLMFGDNRITYYIESSFILHESVFGNRGENIFLHFYRRSTEDLQFEIDLYKEDKIYTPFYFTYNPEVMVLHGNYKGLVPDAKKPILKEIILTKQSRDQHD